jgi:hypothetical protein
VCNQQDNCSRHELMLASWAPEKSPKFDQRWQIFRIGGRPKIRDLVFSS